MVEEAKKDALNILTKYYEINQSRISKREQDKSIFRRQLLGDLQAEIPVFDLFMSVFPEHQLPKYNIWRPEVSREIVAEEIAKIVWLEKGNQVLSKSFKEYCKYFVLYLLFPNGEELEEKILDYYKYASERGFLYELTFDKIVRWIASSYWIKEAMVIQAYKLKLFKLPKEDDLLIEKSNRINEAQIRMLADAEKKIRIDADVNRMKQVASWNSEATNTKMD